MSIVIVTGALAPYTQRLYDTFASLHAADLTVLVCESVEPHRNWVLPQPDHFAVKVLSGLRRHVSYTRHIYLNPSVIPALARLQPHTIVIEDFSPTMALAAMYARATGTRYGIKTDGHRATDPGETSAVHRLMRRMLVPHAKFGICASEDSVALLEHWGLASGLGVEVPIVTAWDAPDCVPDFDQRPFDLHFASAINEHIKGALFFADVAAELTRRGHRLKVRVTGDGPLRQELAARLAQSSIAVQFDGSLQADRMAEAYGSAKLLLFPSRGDAWGLVANEAAMCGTPVLCSPDALSSLRLVEACGVGMVRPMTVEGWADAAAEILSSKARWEGFSAHRATVLQRYSLDVSVAALARAIAPPTA